MNTKHFTFKTGNMNKAQSFILYPYSGEDTIYLQSDKRFIRANLRTGEAIINAKGCDYANSVKLAMNPLKCQLPEDIKTAIQSYLWHNNGKDGDINGVCSFENKQLFLEELTGTKIIIEKDDEGKARAAAWDALKALNSRFKHADKIANHLEKKAVLERLAKYDNDSKKG